MADAVVDASVWVSRLVAIDAHHRDTVDWFEEQRRQSSLLVVPALMPPEVAGAIAPRARDGRLARRAVDSLLRLPTLRLVALDRHLAEEAVDWPPISECAEPMRRTLPSHAGSVSHWSHGIANNATERAES